MSNDPYDTFARIYDAWQAGYPKPFTRAIFPFYEREILRHELPERSLADLACGTGTFLETWAGRHGDWSLHGTDGSRGMLQAARRNLSRADVKARLVQQPLQELQLPRRVGAAVCVFDSVNHLTRLRDLRRFARGVALSLHPNGVFVFDLNDERAFPHLFSGSWTVETKGLFVSVSASCSTDRLRGTLQFAVFERRGRQWLRRDFTIGERNWRREEVRHALLAAGFAILRIRKIHPYRADQVEAPRTLWSCRLAPDRSHGTRRTIDP